MCCVFLPPQLQAWCLLSLYGMQSPLIAAAPGSSAFPSASYAPASLPQIVGIVMSGGRLEVPEPHAVAGRGSGAPFEGLGRYVQLMERCWAQEPEERPAFDAVCSELRWAEVG